VLVADRLTVRYGHVTAVRDVSFEVGDREIVALLGANGAGKTTTLRAITGLAPLSQGDVWIDGQRSTGAAPESLAARGVAHIPEGRGVFPRLTVWQNLKMGGYALRLKPAALDAAIEDVLQRFPALTPRLRQHAGTLSGGEQQMLAIARALIGKPRMLLVDEPSHGLAPKIVAGVFDLFAHLRDTGVSILVVEQFASVALSVADRAIVLDRGRVTLSTTARDVDREHLTGVYLGGAQ
jgi:branched-chain amino acid transport system ATP-binding protein